MRKIIYITLTAVAMLLCSCRDAGLAIGSAEDGVPTTLTLTTRVEGGDVHSRAFSSDAAESAVNNLFVLIFDVTTKNIISTRFFDGLTGSRGNITIRTTSGDRYIYAIANIDLGMMQEMKAKMAAIPNVGALRNFIATLKQNTLGRGTSFLMTGCVRPDGSTEPTAKVVTIPVSGGTAPAITLKRLDSKITFKVEPSPGVTFTPRDWRVCNVQRSIALFTTADDQITADTSYFNSEWTTFEGTGTEFSFYALENRHKGVKQITTTVDPYFLREKQLKTPFEDPTKPDQKVKNGAFEYAPPKGTYVQMRGNIKYNDPQKPTLIISADLTLIVHLGYVASNANDYNNLRNTKYIYTVTLTSASKIIVEVDSKDPAAETQPGTDGAVVLQSNVIYDLDSHYKSESVTFNKSAINKEFSWYVRTPFSEGSPSTGGNITTNLKDYKWVRFKLNPKVSAEGAYSTAILPYPGDQKIYKGELTIAAYDAERAKADGTRCDLLDVDQMITLLKLYEAVTPVSSIFDNAQNVTFTAFVDEFYYYADPNDATKRPIDLWKKFANEPERLLTLTTLIKYSPDGEIMKTEALYAFRQKSIQTMYSLTSTGADQTAWGVETTTEETVARDFGIYNALISTASNQRNGRANTISLWGVGTAQWETYVDIQTGENTTGNQNIRYACMKRNRDNNGDGVIDRDEVRWYLASINQLRDLWIGENSMDIRARLYGGPYWKSDPYSPWGENLYASSSPKRSSGDRASFAVLWSAEGASISVGNVDWLANPGTFYARCARNMGVPDNAEPSVESQDYATYDPTTGIMSLDRLDRRSIRAYTQQNELPEHNERQADNLPWWKFQINGASSGTTGYTFRSLNSAATNGTSPCKDINGVKFRIPNQRELVLMQSRLGTSQNGNDGKWTGLNFSRSTFSFNINQSGVTGNRPGFSVQERGELMCLLTGDQSGGTRCVKDLPYIAPR
ncbi:MAG: DUF4906 domain-containing protein [Mucinivorans sp.]